MAEAEHTRMGPASIPVQSRTSQESLRRTAAQQRLATGSPLKADASPTPRRISSDLDLGKSSSLQESPAASKPVSVRTPQRPAPQAGPSSSKHQPNAPGLGPVFSPVRQVPQTFSSPAPRRVSYVLTVLSGQFA
jgi:hypothetical protein